MITLIDTVYGKSDIIYSPGTWFMFVIAAVCID